MSLEQPWTCHGWKASLVQGPGFWGALEGDQHFILEAYQAGQIM